MSKKTIGDLMKEIEALRSEVKDLKTENKTVNKGKTQVKPDFKTVQQNILKGEDGNPRAYSLVQQKGKVKRIVMGSYARILEKNVRGQPKTESEGWIKTQAEVKGKKVTAYWVPMKKGHLTLDAKDVAELTKGF